MKNHSLIALALTLLLLATRALPTVRVAAQGSRAIFRPDPLSLELNPDEQGTITMLVENIYNLYGLEFHLAFDPQIVQVVDADPATAGVQIEPASWWKDGFVAVNQVDNASGRIDFAATLLSPAQPASGKQEVATITFAARQSGDSILSIKTAILSTRNAEAIPHTGQAGGIHVNSNWQALAPTDTGKPATTSSYTEDKGRLVLAGVSMLTFLIASGVFVFILRRKK